MKMQQQEGDIILIFYKQLGSGIGPESYYIFKVFEAQSCWMVT